MKPCMMVQQGKITLEFTIKLNTIQVTFLSSLPKISENNKVEENGWNSFNQATGQKLEILKFYKYNRIGMLDNYEMKFFNYRKLPLI